MIKVGLASDHAGFELKEFAKEWLSSNGYEFVDFGAFSTESVDYPDFAHKLAKAVAEGECSCGIAVCGTGNGISMALNKHQDIRAALCWSKEIAEMARLHNNANILVMPGRFIDNNTAKEIIEIYFKTEFEGGRHQKRIDKIPYRCCQ